MDKKEREYFIFMVLVNNTNIQITPELNEEDMQLI
jgi:hypothetical protein